jgi:hypothetical protein
MTGACRGRRWSRDNEHSPSSVCANGITPTRRPRLRRYADQASNRDERIKSRSHSPGKRNSSQESYPQHALTGNARHHPSLPRL